MNDQERRLWVLNDEGLYNWWRSSRRAIKSFIRDNRNEIDTCIGKVLNVKELVSKNGRAH